MININYLYKNPKLKASKLWRRKYFLDIVNLIFINNIRKLLQIKTEKLQYKKKKISIKKINKNIFLNNYIKKINKNLKKIKKKIKKFQLNIPNIPYKNIPYGIKYKNNKEIVKWGVIKKKIFKVKNHIELGKKNNNLNWKLSSEISGSNFIFMKGNIALLHRALSQFMLDLHTKKHGYIETYVPYLVNKKSLYDTGQLPKFSNNLFYVSSLQNKKKNYVLIPTGEIPLTNFIRNQSFLKKKLPIMLTAHTPCFRAESNSYGKNSNGLIRMYQFDKVEIVQIVSKKKSYKVLEVLTSHAEEVLKLLKLPYRKILLCAGELSFTSAKTYDLEVWFPSLNIYKEVSSCSNIIDFQSRRMNSSYYYYYKNKKKKYFLHTLNGSGLAIGRVLAAILENYQDINGNIKIPNILRNKYMNGIKFI